MASTNSSTYAALLARNTSGTGKSNASVSFYDTLVTIPAGAAAEDTVNLFTIPAGVTIDPTSISLYAEDPGTTLTVDIGFSDNPDSLVDGLDVAAGGFFLGSAAPGVDFLTGSARTEAGVCYMTFATLATVTTGKKIRVRMRGTGV
jgi:hypothetical protein